MADRRPLILSSGVPRELTSSDVLALPAGSDLSRMREMQGLIATNGAGSPGALDTVAMSSGARTIEILLHDKLPNGTSIGSIKWNQTTAMTGGVGSVAIFGSNSLTSTSWTRLGSNVTCTTALQAGGRQSITYSTSTTDDMWIRIQLVLTTAPSVYPVFATALLPVVLNAAGGHLINGSSNGTGAPGSTLDPSTGWSNISPPMLALA